MHDFTPFSALLGGSLIGLSASLLMLAHGRVAGISGIFAGVFEPAAKDRGFRLHFLAGLLLAGVLARVVHAPTLPGATPSLVIGGVAGLLVGAGTRLGSGCTSGHGVCGLSRLSKRSLVATLTFMATAMITVAVLRALGAGVVIPRIATLLAGLVLGLGLVIAGMTNPAKVTGFLDVGGRWDPSLALVMVGAIGVHFVLLRRILRRPKPLFANAFDTPRRTAIDGRLVLGAAIFGVGWGLGGVCPGPGIVDAASGSAYALVFTVAMALGAVAMRSRGAGAA